MQNKVYDGRASKKAGQQSSQRGPGKSRNDSSYGSDSEVDDCQFDFEEQSVQDLRVPQAKYLQSHRDQGNKDKKDVASSSLASLKPLPGQTTERPAQALKPVTSVVVTEAEQSASLSEVIESKFKNLTILTSSTKNNLLDKADLKEELEKRGTARKSQGAELLRDKAIVDAGHEEGRKTSALSASSPTK